MEEERKRFILVTDKGLMGQKGMSSSEVMAMLLYAFLYSWNDDVHEIDILEAEEKILDLLEELGYEDSEEEEVAGYGFEDVMKYLLGEEDDAE